jgi:16S rRNA (cytosine967-C5)-methyltransferase
LLKDAWALAIETLSQVELQKLSERLALARASRQLGTSNSDAFRYAYGLVVETVRRRNLIDKFTNSIIKPKTLDELSLGVQAFVRLYVYQTRVTKNWAEPDVEEAARIAKLTRAILGWKTVRVVEPFLGFLLTSQIEPIFKAATDEERVALQTFHPTWFVEYCFRLFGRKEAIAFLEGSIYAPPVFVRLNTLKASQEEIVARLKVEDVTLEKTEPLKHTYRIIESKRPLTRLASHGEGLFYVQDKASCFAAEVADPKPGSIVLDVCAAPGAKTSYLAQLMQNKGAIYSLDYSVRRMRTWKQEIRRLGTLIAEPVIADARSNLPLDAEADVVVLDPPCTSTGVFGRMPSSKWRLTPKSIEHMAEIQWLMINNCAEKVKHGGLLTYSTCTVTVEENEMIIERFLKWHPEFQLAEITPNLGLLGLRGLTKCRRLYPHLHESNGFFIAKLQKEET